MEIDGSHLTEDTWCNLAWRSRQRQTQKACLTPCVEASDTPNRAASKWVTTLFFGVAYKYFLASSRATLLVFWHTWHPCEPKQTPSTHLHHWFFIVVRLGVIPSAFYWVIASSGTWGSTGCGCLVTLSGCHHLSGLENRRRIDTSWWLFVAISRWLWGVLCLRRWSVKGNSSELRVSLSYLTCG